MPVDPSIYSQLRQPEPVNKLAMLAQMAQLQGAQDQSSLAQYTIGKARRGDEETNALTAAIRGGLDISTPDGQRQAYGVAPTVAPGLIKSHMESQKERSLIDENKAKTDKLKNESVNLAMQQSRDMLGSVNDPQAAAAWLQAQFANPQLAPVHALSGRTMEQAIAAIPTDMAKFAEWKRQNQLGAEKLVAFTTPDANTVLTSKTSADNNAATNATHIKTTGMNNATSLATNAATIAKDYNIAGMKPDGTSTGANDSMVDAIGQYKVAPPNGMALRNPRMQQILAEVTAKYPDFDSTQYGARQVAAKSFSTGKDGQSVQSANTALNHLGTLRELAAAQDNGNIRLFNTLANRFATETGGAAPTNLAAAITMVGPEISKAVIGAGGTGEDRNKVDAALAALTKGGKGQAAGTLATMEDLFGGRLTEAKRTYERTTGRKDFTDVLLSPAAQKVLAARSAAPAAAATQGAPKAGAVQDGYRFKGGNPADPKSWEKV